MDTFRDLVEANLGSLASAAGEAVADKVKHTVKQAANAALSPVSARATGRLDLNTVAHDIIQKWKYFTTTQRAQSTVATFIDFIQTVYGMNIPEEQVYTAIYGYDPTKSPKPPQIMAPNKAVLADRFKVIFSAKATQPKLLAASQDLVRYAENNDADQDYVVLMLKWLGAKNPQMLQRAGMEPLKAFSHGGVLNKDDLDKLVKGLASLILKQMMRMKQDSENEANGDGEAVDADGDGEPDTKDTGKQVSSTPGAISINPPATQQKPNWGGIIRSAQGGKRLTREEVFRNVRAAPPAGLGYNNLDWAIFATNAENDGYWKTFQHLFETGMAFRKTNAISAQLMFVIGREMQISQNEFTTAVLEFQRTNQMMYWPRVNIMAAFDYARAGGNFDEITADLNHFCKNAHAASMILTVIARFIGKVDAQTASGGAPAPTPAAPAGSAP